MKGINAMGATTNSLEYEKILYRYSSALERGDFEAVAAILELAQADPELERMLLELNQAYVSNSASQPQPVEPGAAARRAPAHWRERLRRFFKDLFSSGPLSPVPSRSWAVLGAGALVVLLVAFGVFSIIAGLNRLSQTNGARGLLLNIGGTSQALAPTVNAPPLIQAPLPTTTPAPTWAAAPIEAPAATQAPANAPGLPYPGPGSGGLGQPAQPYPVPQGVALPGSEHLIVRNGYLTLVVTDTRKSRDAIQSLVAGMSAEGAYVVSSSEMFSGDAAQPVIQMDLRVPAERFEDVMNALSAMALRVDARNESAQDVTAEYVDLAAQLEQLQAARQRLLEIMKEAKNTDDLLRAEGLLTQRETEIASIQGRMKYLQQTAQLSSIQVVLNPSVLNQPIQPTGWNPVETARLALSRLVGRFQAFTDWLINFSIATLPWLLGLSVLVLGAWRLVIRRRPG
jgi:Domain of unknown function (DUF4349)